MSTQIQIEVLFLLIGYVYYYLKNKKKDFKRVCTRSVCTKIRGKFICNRSDIGFIIRDIISLNCTFSILPLAESTNLKVYLTLYHWLLKQVFYMIKILFFILISRYGCFGFLYVCMYVCLKIVSVELHCQNHNGVLEFRMFYKDFWSVITCYRHYKKVQNGLLTFSKNKNVTPFYYWFQVNKYVLIPSITFSDGCKVILLKWFYLLDRLVSRKRYYVFK